jgi:hypothetical protein
MHFFPAILSFIRPFTPLFTTHSASPLLHSHSFHSFPIALPSCSSPPFSILRFPRCLRRGHCLTTCLLHEAHRLCHRYGSDHRAISGSLCKTKTPNKTSHCVMANGSTHVPFDSNQLQPFRFTFWFILKQIHFFRLV